MFDIISALSTLEDAWSKVKANGGGPGGDGMTLFEFEMNRGRRLSTLQRSLQSGEYWPGPLKVVSIPKKTGGVRVLRIPTILDRVAQTAAALVLTPKLDPEFEDESFGYRPGRSVQQAVARVATLRREGYHWTVDGDIDDYFDSVPHRRLLERITRYVDCERTVDLISRWLEAYSDTERGLPQGGPISPLLANLYLDDVDEAIQGKGVRLVRFADDFLLMCNSEMAALEAREKMAGLLAREGLALNAEKTRVTRFEEATRFLGHLFVRGLSMPAEYEEAATAIAEADMRGPDVPAPSDAEPDAGALPVDRLRWIYVQTPGRVLSHRNLSLTVEDADGAELAAVPAGWADGIELGEAVHAEDAALRLALAHGVPVYYVDGSGRTLGRLEPPLAERAAVHLDQARTALDPKLAAALAARIVAGKLSNQRAQLYRLNRSRKNTEIKDAAKKIGRLVRLARIQESVDHVRGVEGQAAALYWPALGLCLPDHFRIKNRTRRPPTDPANFAISFLSGRLMRDVDALIHRRGLHPGFSCLHSVQDGRASLALDLMEPYRAAMVEGVVVTLFARGALTEAMFEKKGPGVKAAPEAFRRLVEAYERFARSVVRNPRDGHRTSWRGLIEEEVLAYQRHVRGVEVYAGYEMEY